MTLWWALERLDGPDDPDGSPSPPVGAPLELLEGTACDRGVLAGVAVAAATGSLSTKGSENVSPYSKTRLPRTLRASPHSTFPPSSQLQVEPTSNLRSLT